MKKYRVNVNGTVYEVELEEITGAAPAAAAPAVYGLDGRRVKSAAAPGVYVVNGEKRVVR